MGDTYKNTEHKPASPKGSWDLSSFSNENSRRQPAGDKGVAPPTGVEKNNKHKHALETDVLLLFQGADELPELPQLSQA